MVTYQQVVTILAAVLAAMAISFVLTPLVKRLAIRWGFVDIPKDERRMHHKPIPTIGGLAIFLAFLIVTLWMSDISRQLLGMLGGSLVIVLLGIIDDKYDLNAKLKFVVQILAACIPVSQGCVIRYISQPFQLFGSSYLNLHVLAVPVTILWIVAITNAVNFIDGLDGLSVGICSISCLSMGIIALTVGQSSEALILGALLGACLGFLPYNFNPAKIFMGDTGATFLGFMLACLSVSGLFKLYTVISFAVPILVLGVPLFDIFFACLRRMWHHVSPMHPDRSHIHHRLIDAGFNQRQSVTILYVVASLLGVLAVLVSTSGAAKALMVLVAVIVVGIIALALLTRSEQQKQEQDEAEHTAKK
jgi:UDP-GlcNAc:undecaprenyl-phosphate GlcNAc-1-phosphate transferase